MLELLRFLGPTDWGRPTPCPAWCVADLVRHLVGTDLSLIRWLRDQHRGTVPPDDVDGHGFSAWLDQLQLDWVAAARRISPGLAIELLALLGPVVTETMRSRDANVVDAAVTWASDAPVPRWLDHGRELTEAWIHRQQLLKALDRRADLDPVGDEALEWRWLLQQRTLHRFA